MGNTLIILGNGFDLDMGWRTSYADFYRSNYQSFNSINRMSYIANLISGQHWYDFEGYLRRCICDVTEDKLDELNLFWIFCRNRIGDYLSKDDIYTTNFNSCAYTFLQNIHDAKIVSFNYTNPYKRIHLPSKNINHIHGSLDNRLTGAELKFGVDTKVINENILAQNDLLKHIIKSTDTSYFYDILLDLKGATNIIFYGHSLGITDSDYFKSFFERVIDGKITKKNIYIVTYDFCSLQSIIQNLSFYEIDYSKLLLSDIRITPIYTSQGVNDASFRQLIEIL